MQEFETRSVILADGRRLAYTEFGDPKGWPVFHCHAGLIGRLDVVSAAGEAHALGIRLISPDRPGVGHSDPKPGRTTRDWASDVSELADALGIERFSVYGCSMGGQYALACAAVLRPRVERVAFASGAVPLDDPHALAELNLGDRTLTRLARRASPVAAGVFAISGRLCRWLPGPTMGMTARLFAPPDRDAIERMGIAFAHATADAMRQPRGMVEEYRAWARPWGFRPEDVEAPVDLWFGAEDRLVPPTWHARLARRLPHAELHVMDGSGHLVAYDRWREVLSRLDPRAASRHPGKPPE
ncbi:alpha/beta fold hydrolase [Streptomyces sp. NPDC012637]|uniref:alpha/beta fold hydrolase n=1 Tax=Streptomyces sp. NPDC012637 TaxID=3364842 RepID=UPI0036E933A2